MALRICSPQENTAEPLAAEKHLRLRVSVPTMPMLIAHAWWPWSALIALTGSMIGAIYPGLKAARQDAIEALAYD